jgi:putative endonuclease
VTERQDLGDFGERVARHRLEADGMQVLATKVRVASGEIDLLAREGEDLVFVEVRSRRVGAGSAAETLTPTKLRRMWQCALDYCETEGADPELIRLDVVCLDLERGRVVGVEHLRGIDVPDEGG